jgi:membrane protein required for colicin V production
VDASPTGLPWIDAVGAGLLILLAASGLWSGLWKQLMRTSGLAAAILVPRALAPGLAPQLASALPDLTERLAYGLLWAILFLTTLLAAGLLVRLGTKGLNALNLRFLDRLLGALLGLVTGLMVHGVVLLLLCQFAPAAWTRETLEGTTSLTLLDTLARRAELLLDAESMERICPWLDPIPGHIR